MDADIIPEECLEVFRQFCAPGVSGVHGDEQPHGRSESYLTPLKEKPLLLVPNGVLYRLDLHSHHRQNLHRDAIELVKAPPGSRLCQPLVDVADGLVIHLLRAVEDVYHDPQSTAEVLCCLRLPRTCRSGWSATHDEMEGLSQGDVASEHTEQEGEG